MSELQDELLTTFFKDGRDGTEMLPAALIIAECTDAGFDASEVLDAIETLVAQGQLSEADNHYGIAEGAPLSLTTHRGGDSTPWQFSLLRTDDELMLTQAKAGPEKFDPVLKRFTIEEQVLGDDPVAFHHAVSRRVWQTYPDDPITKSQRSEGRIFELLYRDPTGYHFDRADPDDEPTESVGSQEFIQTDHPGVTVSSTYLRAKEDGVTRYTEDRDYRISEEILEHYAEVYVLSYYELNEESTTRCVWKTDDAIAHRLVADG
jgi:hypothetical protein